MRRDIARLHWLLLVCIACASTPGGVRQSQGESRVLVDPAARFWFSDSLALGHPPADSLLNRNGSRRISDPALYERFQVDVAPALAQWSADPRVRVNPAFVAALIAKESGFDPRATSAVPAIGLAQMTVVADADLGIISSNAPAWHWVHDEMRAWPRSPEVHTASASKARIDSLLATGALGPGNEYLFDARTATRASVLWVRMLAQMWTEDTWPGKYGSMARAALSDGAPLSETDLLALVTVSYNQGHAYVADLVRRYGRDWTAHLNPESSDYLERIGHYTVLFQR